MDAQTLRIKGMKWRETLLWLASLEKPLVATYHPESGTCEMRLTHSHPVADVCPSEEGLWLITGGGKLGRQLILWSLEKDEAIRQFDCPDGAAGGMTVQEGKIWLTHRHNRKLFCLDPNDGKVKWVIQTEKETFSPASCGGELWLIECDPGPLGHWSGGEHAEYFFIRYDTAREKVVDRLRSLSSQAVWPSTGNGFGLRNNGGTAFLRSPETP